MSFGVPTALSVSKSGEVSDAPICDRTIPRTVPADDGATVRPPDGIESAVAGNHWHIDVALKIVDPDLTYTALVTAKDGKAPAV